MIRNHREEIHLVHSGPSEHLSVADDDAVDLNILLIPKTPAQVELSRLEEAYLEEHIFAGLSILNPPWETSSIRYFTPKVFLSIIDRCKLVDVALIGMEVFTTDGELLSVNLGKEDTYDWADNLTSALLRQTGICISAAFSVPFYLTAKSTVPADLIKAYEKAEYSYVANGTRRRFKIGDISMYLVALIREHGTDAAYFITAHNPLSCPTKTGENSSASERLQAMLNRLGAVVYPASSEDLGKEWPVEVGFLVLRVQLEEIQTLADQFKQHAVVCVPQNGCGHLILLM